MNEENNHRIQVWSSGGGVQSTAIAALICMGELKPDISVIVDTEREISSTWKYLDRWIIPALAKAGCTLHRISKSSYATVDLYGSGERLLIPAFTDETGRIGKLPTYCSTEWKKRVVRRFVSRQFPKDAKFSTWLGISTDESKRMTQELGRWQPRYPLIERHLSREACQSLVNRMGWPEAPKTSCWMCPNRSTKAWAAMKDSQPDDFAKAVQFEKEIRQQDDAVFLHKAGKPLNEVDLSADHADLFTGRCDTGYCFT